MKNRWWLVCVLLLLVTLCSGEAEDSKSEETPAPVPTMKPFIAVWRLLGPKIIEKDTQRTVTRRESSLIVSKDQPDDDTLSMITVGTGNRDTFATASESSFVLTRPQGAIRNEIVTLFFESMLTTIVDSWDVLSTSGNKQEGPQTPDERSINEPVIMRKRKSIVNKQNILRAKASRSKLLETNSITLQVDPLHRVWWSGADERAVIRFSNGNIYEGGISMKCMNGEGRFQWADGTIYLGHFKENEICGQGKICWKDDTWYEGEFVGNIRHGKGLFVDSRGQRSYAGEWHNGTKHGHGRILYAEASYRNSYEGSWDKNVRHGFGIREYCKCSGYQGTYDNSIREGKGLMIWPNHDVYTGGWKNGTMSGKGVYIWDIFYNYTMSMPCQTVYIGDWLRGQRHGKGVLGIGVGYGALYKGQFRNNKKHGDGKFITSNGLILRNKHLFFDDNFGSLVDDASTDSSDMEMDESRKTIQQREGEPFAFDLCDDRVGLTYHVHQAYNNIDKEQLINTAIINEYFDHNKVIEQIIIKPPRPHKRESSRSNKVDEQIDFDIEEFFTAEETFLYQAIKCYEKQLKLIYHKYSTICNTHDIYFRPVLIRLYVWQLFFDCNIHKKGVNFVEIDKLIRENPDWQIKTTHYPFQRILFWQFVHCLIAVAIKLYGKKELPGPKPDNICGLAFRRLMECDILPGIEVQKGHLAKGHALIVPLKGLYKLYRSLGEPHTVRTFIMAVRKPSHDLDELQPPVIEIPRDEFDMGHNAYVMGDDLRYIIDDEVFSPVFSGNKKHLEQHSSNNEKLKLFNFANISTRTVLSFFAKLFPQIITDGKIMDLDINITFYEFFEVFLCCVEKSNRIAEFEENTSAESKSDSLFEIL